MITKILLFLFSIVLLAATQGSACSCVFFSPKKQMKHSSVVFLGKVLAVERFRKDFHIATLQVIKAWKMKRIETQIKIVSYDFGEACGFPFALGESYLVFDDPEAGKAEKSSPYFYTHLCTGTSRAKDAGEEIMELGRPKFVVKRP